MSDHSRFLAPARLIATLTALSRLLGVLRETFYAYHFGVSPAFSAYRIAFMIPNLARRLFGEGAMASAFIPVLAEVMHRDGRQQACKLAGGAITLLGGFLILLTLLAEAVFGAAHWIRPSAVMLLTLIMMPYMVLICLTAFAGGMLNTVHRFAMPAAAPIVLNVVLIAALWAGAERGLDEMPLLIVVSAAVLVAGALQLGMQLVELRRAAFFPRFHFDWADPDLKRIVAMMGPMLLGLAAVQINVLADKLIAFFFVPEARGPSVLGYADMLQHLPQGVFSIAIATAIFPLLSAKAAQRDHRGLALTVEAGIRMNTFIAMPAAVGLIMLAYPIVSVVYERGVFQAEQTRLVAGTLIAYSIGMVGYCAQPVLARAFYSLKDTHTPVRIAVWIVGLNLGLSVILVFPLQEAGIALGSGISAIVQMIWLSHALRRRLPELHWPSAWSSAARTALACAGMALFLLWIASNSALDGVGDTVLLLIAIPGGVLVFALCAYFLRCPELHEMRSRPKPPGN